MKDLKCPHCECTHDDDCRACQKDIKAFEELYLKLADGAPDMTKSIQQMCKFIMAKSFFISSHPAQRRLVSNRFKELIKLADVKSVSYLIDYMIRFIKNLLYNNHYIV